MKNNEHRFVKKKRGENICETNVENRGQTWKIESKNFGGKSIEAKGWIRIEKQKWQIKISIALIKKRKYQF